MLDELGLKTRQNAMTVTRKFLTLADDSKECVPAILFAAMRAKKVGAGLIILRSFEISGMGHWAGIDADMRTETRDHALAEAQSLARQVKERVGIEAEVIVFEGKPEQGIADVAAKDSTVKVLVLGAGWGKGGPGPLVSRIGKGKSLTKRPIAITIIPGNLTDDQLNEMGGSEH